jgi:thiamine-phosphate pyrophosphorylase
VSANSSLPVSDREIPILCYVTDRRSLAMPAAERSVASGFGVECARLVEKIVGVAAAGVDWVQIREKELASRELAGLTREAVARVRVAGSSPAGRANPVVRVIVNDHLDVAIEAGADGVHLGEASLPVADVAAHLKRINFSAADRKFLIGASCHSLDGAKAVVRDGADYIFFGPVFATPSKAKFGEPQGVKKLAAVCSAVGVPVIAIGGITLDNAGECIAAGAAGIAAIRLFQDAVTPSQIVSTLKKLRR